MALRWDIEKCKNYMELKEDGLQWKITEACIFMSVAVGMGSITEQNAREFYARMNLIQKISGPIVGNSDGGYLITPEDIHRRIGLSTNVSTETRAHWVKRTIGDEMTGYLVRYDRATKEKEVVS